MSVGVDFPGTRLLQAERKDRTNYSVDLKITEEEKIYILFYPLSSLALN